MNAHTRVTWERGDLPPAFGTITEVTPEGLHMVRDDHNMLHGFPEHQLTEVT